MRTFTECSTGELAETVGQLHALMCAAQREMLAVVSEMERREAWQEDGATSMAAWLSYSLAVSHPTARDWSRVGVALEALPALGEAFGDGRLSYDQVAPLTRATKAETDAAIAAEAPGWTAAQCAAFARRARPVTAAEAADAQARRSVRWHWDL
ncbi:MAG: DUF222 domain-containing protein, partial [Acidimicrobiales bacterium]